MNEIEIYKKEVRKKYKKLSNIKLLELYDNNKIDELVNSLLPLVINISNKYYSITHYEDIIQYGNLGLMNGIKNFDKSKSDKIISFCRNYINYSILDNLQYDTHMIKLPVYNKNNSQRTIDKYPTVFNADDITDFDYQDEDYVEPKITRKEIEDLLMTIPNIKYSKVQVFLDYIFIQGITYREISKNNGYSMQNVSLIIKDIVNKIKNNKNILQRIGDMLKIN